MFVILYYILLEMGLLLLIKHEIFLHLNTTTTKINTLRQRPNVILTINLLKLL